jgi:hypothetical protein
MQSSATLRGALSIALALATGCANLDAGPGYSNGYGNVTVAGSDVQNHVPPPVGYQCYPHYFVRDGYVYDVNGHYYKEHNGYWSTMRGTPSLVRYQEPEVSNDPRCTQYPP